MNREMFDLLDDYCIHGNNPPDCPVPCVECNHECSEHNASGECLRTVNGFSTNDSPAVDGECDCEEFKD
jgi:hypothetical protein